MVVAKHVVRYLKGIVEYGLNYDTNQKTNLCGYVDSDWEGSSIERKSTLGCFFNLRFDMIYWFGRMQSYMALSTTEAEYVATFSASSEVVCFFKATT